MTLIEQIVLGHLMWAQPCPCHMEYTEEPDADADNVAPPCGEGSRYQVTRIWEYAGEEPHLHQRLLPRGGRNELT